MTHNGAGTPAIVFDIDGALLTTGGADAVAWARAFEEQYGAPAAARRAACTRPSATFGDNR